MKKGSGQDPRMAQSLWRGFKLNNANSGEEMQTHPCGVEWVPDCWFLNAPERQLENCLLEIQICFWDPSILITKREQKLPWKRTMPPHSSGYISGLYHTDFTQVAFLVLERGSRACFVICVILNSHSDPPGAERRASVVLKSWSDISVSYQLPRDDRDLSILCHHHSWLLSLSLLFFI